MRFCQAMTMAMVLLSVSAVIGGMVNIGWRVVKRGRWDFWEDGEGREMKIGEWDKDWVSCLFLDSRVIRTSITAEHS